MPRQPRIRSKSGFYHVMLRGNGKQILFEDNADRRKFISILIDKLAGRSIEVIAWCLMNNHVHLLLNDPELELSSLMHRVATGYAMYFNAKAGHVGSVFQNRFTSVAIKDEAQLLQVVRYIHLNPQKAGICSAERYIWSSYSEYIGEPFITATETVLDELKGTGGFRRFHLEAGDGSYAPVTGKRVPREAELIVARQILGNQEPAAIKALPRTERNSRLRDLRDGGLTLKQIGRLTGIGERTVSRATKA